MALFGKKRAVLCGLKGGKGCKSVNEGSFEFFPALAKDPVGDGEIIL